MTEKWFFIVVAVILAFAFVYAYTSKNPGVANG